MNENEKRLGRWAFTAYLLACILAGLIGSTCRADTTKVWQAIEKPKPTVCEKVCPVCGNCIPIKTTIINVGIDKRIDCKCANDKRVAWVSFYVDSCDSIIWGRYRIICRIDTIGKRLVGGPPNEPYALWWQRIDTIYTDDPRCRKPDTSIVVGERKPFYHDTIPVVPSRGLDSTFNVKEKIWYYYNWSNGKRVNMRLSK